MGSVICHTALNALLMGSISVYVVVLMMLVLLNGDYRIAVNLYSTVINKGSEQPGDMISLL